jgi:rhodanese-related sulfurtransferase
LVENVSPTQAWDALRADPDARLVDVRTEAEWDSVGIPDLSEAGREAIMIPWQIAPTMQVNARFLEHLRAAGAAPGQKLYFLCRTGGRSTAAAQAATRAGYAHAYNVADGFEGAADAHGQRGAINGWKAEGLPWRQR